MRRLNNKKVRSNACSCYVSCDDEFCVSKGVESLFSELRGNATVNIDETIEES